MKKAHVMMAGFIMACSQITYAQDWNMLGNASGAGILGTLFASPISIYTNSTQKGEWTYGTGIPAGYFGVAGDGLRIYPNAPGSFNGYLDLWTSTSSLAANETHIKWDGTGQIGGSGGWFRMWSNAGNGLDYNTIQINSRYIFRRVNNETARIGTNDFWRIGANPSTLDAVRRLSVIDDGIQFRLGRNANNAVTDFTTTSAGDLNIEPYLGTPQNVGIHVGAPSERLDVNGNARLRDVPTVTSDYIMTGVQEAGTDDIRFSKLGFTGSATDVLLGDGTWGSAPAVLTADNGATVNPAGNVQWGQVFSGAPAGGELLHDTEIPFNEYNILFTDDISATSGQNRMQLGWVTGGIPINTLSRFSSIQGENQTNIFRIGGYFSTTTNFPTPSIADFNPIYFGSIALSYRIGAVAIASSYDATAVRFIGLSAGAYNDNSILNYGVSGKSYGSPGLNYGGYFISSSANATSINYGLFASAGAGSINAAAYFGGNIDGTGTFNYVSDRNLKQNIQALENASEILTKLNPKTYEFKTTEYPQMKLQEGQQIGLISQEVQQILPALVRQSAFPEEYDSLGNILHQRVNYMSLNYAGLVPVLVGGHNEQGKEIDSLKEANKKLNERLTQMEQCISKLNLCNDTGSQNNEHNNTPAKISNVELTNGQSIVLDQNVPNPFAEQTAITYFLTDEVKHAQMLFYNSEGKLINSVELTERGKGQLNVFANDLSNGIYTYTLVVDGKIMDTKRMVKNK